MGLCVGCQQVSSISSSFYCFLFTSSSFFDAVDKQFGVGDWTSVNRDQVRGMSLGRDRLGGDADERK